MQVVGCTPVQWPKDWQNKETSDCKVKELDCLELSLLLIWELTVSSLGCFNCQNGKNIFIAPAAGGPPPPAGAPQPAGPTISHAAPSAPGPFVDIPGKRFCFLFYT